MTQDFGDFDPEDAYDVEDDPDMRVAVLEKVVESLRNSRRDTPQDSRFDARRTDALRVIRNFLDEHTDRQNRLEELKTELETL